MEHQSFWDVAKGIFRRKCIDLCSYIRKETVWKSARRNTLQQTRNQQHGCLHISRETEARGSGAACSQGWKADERSAQTPTREQRDRGQRQRGGVFTGLEGR